MNQLRVKYSDAYCTCTTQRRRHGLMEFFTGFER